jgi:hypothetical protein
MLFYGARASAEKSGMDGLAFLFPFVLWIIDLLLVIRIWALCLRLSSFSLAFMYGDLVI